MSLPNGYSIGLTKEGFFSVDEESEANISITSDGVIIEIPDFIVTANTSAILVGNSSHNTFINSTAVIAENFIGANVSGGVIDYNDPPQVVNLFGADYPIFGYYNVEDASNANPAASHTTGLYVRDQMKAGHVGGLVSLTTLAEINEVPANIEAGAIMLGHNNLLVHTANLRPFGVSLIMEGGSSAIVSGGGFRGAMAGYEIAIGAFSDSIPFAKFGLLIDDMGPVADTNHGTEWDARICLSSLNGVGARDQILISDASGRHPFPADGSGNILRVQSGAVPTINNGIDLRGANVTGLAYASNGYSVTGAGYITVGNTTLNSAINATSVVTTAIAASIYIAQGSTGGAGQVLTAAGTGFASWEDLPEGGGEATDPAGANTEIQFNDSGAFGANTLFKFDKATTKLTVGNSTVNTTTNSTAISVNNIFANVVWCKTQSPFLGGPGPALILGDPAGAVYQAAVMATARVNPAHTPFVAFAGDDSGSLRGNWYGGGGWGLPDAMFHNFYVSQTYSETPDTGLLRFSINYDYNISAAPLFIPGSNDGASLGGLVGSDLYGWSDLFLASGAVINFNNGNHNITHSAGRLTFSNTIAVGSNVTVNTSTLHFGNTTVNAHANSLILWIQNPTANAFMEADEFTVANSTVTTRMTPGGYGAGANVSLNSVRLSVGNTTANLIANSIIVSVANSTGTANLQPTQLVIGSSVVTDTAMGVGANVFINSTLFFAGNSTVNTTVNSATVSVANAIGTTSLLADGLVVGNATRLSTYDVSFATSPCLQLLGTGANGSSLTGSRFSNDTSAPSFIIAKSRGATVGDYTVVQDNDPLGRIVFEGSDGGSFIEGARIYAQIDGTPGDNDMPSELIFATTPDAGQAATDRWIIGPDGHFKAATDASFDIGTASLRPRNITASANVHAQSGLAPPIGGAAAFLCSSTAGLGIYFGANAPTISAAQGSIYIRTNGSSTTTRMYINTNGGTTWTAVNTVA